MDLMTQKKTIEFIYDIIEKKNSNISFVKYKPEKESFKLFEDSIEPLPRSTPEEQGISSKYLENFYNELKNIDAVLQNAIYKSDIQILMYENAIRQYISNGRLSFFNTTITLSLEQRQRHIEYMEKILKENEDIDIKLINGNLVDDFKNKENPTAYLSRNINIIKGNFDEYSEYENKYLIIRDNRLDNIFKRFFKEVWESERYNISKFKEEVIIRISDLLNYINILKSTVEK